MLRGRGNERGKGDRRVCGEEKGNEGREGTGVVKWKERGGKGRLQWCEKEGKRWKWEKTRYGEEGNSKECI